MKKIVVTGPEGSGTRLMTRILKGTEAIVMHRSMPYEGGHLRHWPTDRDWDGFKPDWLVIMHRDLDITTQSQVRAGHVGTIEEAAENIRQTWVRLDEWVQAHEVAVAHVQYERLVEAPSETIENLCQILGIIPPCAYEEIVDGNAKYR